MKIVTAGAAYMDIDAYAGCVAYAELLRVQGFESVAASTGTLNKSITQSIRSWKVQYLTSYSPKPEDTFIIVDTSNPDYFDSFVVADRIEEVIDHHPGFELYWDKRIGQKAHIDFIGAACTLIYEKWDQSGLLNKMSQTSARLLVTGILDNTLNFKAHVTTERDKQAYDALLKTAAFSRDWPPQYFGECQTSILEDIEQSLSNDTKHIDFIKLTQKPTTVGQLVVWDAQGVLAHHQKAIADAMRRVGKNWFVNIVSIDTGKSYFLCENNQIRDWLEKIMDVKFEGALATANRLWLRKEIIKQDLQEQT